MNCTPELEARIRFADAVQAAVDIAFAGHKATARKTGRRAEWPYVPVVVHPDGRTEQILAAAFETRAAAVDCAERALLERRVDLTRKLSEPRYRALREYHLLPREIPS